MRLLAFLAVLFSAAAFAQADLILVNGKIVTADDKNTVAQAIAIKGERIVAVGSNKEVRALGTEGARVVDLGGRTVIPGLIDSHIHAIRAALSYGTEVHWFGAASVTEAVERVRAAAKASQPGRWLIVAGGWTEEQFKERRRPTQAELVAAAPQNPVYVQWMYGWAMLTPLAHEALGFKAEADLPGGGKYELDASGKPTGAIVGGIVPLFDKLPKPSFAQKVEGTKKFFRELNRVGLTGLSDPGGFNMSPTEYQPLLQVWRERQLTLRVAYSYFSQKKGQELAEFKELTQLLPMGFGDGLLRFNGIGERVTFGMYNNDNPSAEEKEQFYQAAKWAAEQGMTLTQHWQNGQSIGHLLEVLERLDKEVSIQKLRWSVAHLNDGTEETLRRMKALGMGWTMQDAMYYEGERALKARGADDLKRMPPLKTAMKVGIPIGAGTDAHRVANYNPFVALRWILDGKSAGGVPLRGPDETPNRIEALKMYTLGSAWFVHDDSNRGSLTPGKLADLAVLSADYLTVPVGKIGEIHSLFTMVSGRAVYAEREFQKLQ